MGRHLTSAVVFVAVGLMPLLMPGAAVAADNIGVAAAVQNQVEGSGGGTPRTLAAGSQVFQDETIRTGVQSTAQLLFLDETSLSIGPQSDVTLDKFVFNPATGAGDVVLSTTKGAFRFITGSQDPANYQLKTPFASIGVRGTIVDYNSSAIGLYATVQEGFGEFLVGGVTYRLGPGETLFVSANGEVVAPFPADGHFYHVTGIIPGPLYGAFLPGDHQRVEVPDGSTVRLDELFPQTPPVSDGDGCEPYCNDSGF